MAFTDNAFECDYLRSHSPPFQSKQAEIVHINEQISSLDSHISQLNTLRRALHRRSYQLHNLLSPIRILPIEVLSFIFQQVIDPGDYNCLDFWEFCTCLRQAFVLSSVSAHFRHVALGTPELWNRIPLRINGSEAIGKASSLLQHCMALATNVSISVYDYVDEQSAFSAIETLLTPDRMQRIKAFKLDDSKHAASHWINKLKGSSTL